MRDRKRKILDRKSTVFDRAKLFSFREQTPSYVRSKSRLGFSCGVSGMPAVGIIRNLNIRVLTQLRLELFRVQLLLYNCTGWISTQSICTCCSTGVATILCVACCSCSTLYIVCIYFFVHVRSTSQRGSLIPVVVVVVVDSHIQRIVLATEETTVTQQVSLRPIKCQSRLWSQRGTKVNGSHHGDNPLLRPTGIQIATKSYAAVQAMAPTNIKTVHQTSLLHIESNLDRLGMLSPTHDQRSQQKTGKITLQPVLINKSKFLKATHFVQK